MQDVILFILSVSGLTWIVTRSQICRPMRERVTMKHELYKIASKVTSIDCIHNRFNVAFYGFFDKIFNCSGCFGFWSGAICWTIHYLYIDILLYAFSGATISLLIVSFIRILEKK